MPLLEFTRELSSSLINTGKTRVSSGVGRPKKTSRTGSSKEKTGPYLRQTGNLDTTIWVIIRNTVNQNTSADSVLHWHVFIAKSVKLQCV